MLPKVNTLEEFYQRPGRWTKGVTARDKNGNPCETDSGHAVALCLGAAVYYVYGPDRVEEITAELLELINSGLDHTQSFEELSGWNDCDERTFKDVRSLVTRAQR